jgi:acyl-CoA dehydrogenase
MVERYATPRLGDLIGKYRSFVQEEIVMYELSMLSSRFSENQKSFEALREKARRLGLWAPHLPEAEGGLGLTMLEFAQVSEVMAYTPFGHYVFNCQAPDIGNMELMHRHASDAQKERFMQPLMSGDIRSCFCMTEPGFAGSNPVRMGTMARREGDEWVIQGHKWFATGADGSSFAVVMAVTDPDAPVYERASLLIVPTDTPGFNLVRNIPVMGEPSDGHHSHGEIIFSDCRIPYSHLLGPEGAGFRLAQERLGPGRIHHCMRWIGICERAFDMMCQRAVSRDMGDGGVLADKQTIRAWIAESRASIDASRLMVLDTAERLDRLGAKAVRDNISTIKFFVADVLMKVLDRAIQTHGALGITDDTPLAYWYRHERGARIYDGPDEVHKSSVARSILKRYASEQSGKG